MTTNCGTISQRLRRDGAARNSQREDIMTRGHQSLLKSLLAGSMLAAVGPVLAADVTSDRLVKADKEPHNWVMKHPTYDGPRFSPLARLDQCDVKKIQLAPSVSARGRGGQQ